MCCVVPSDCRSTAGSSSSQSSGRVRGLMRTRTPHDLLQGELLAPLAKGPPPWTAATHYPPGIGPGPWWVGCGVAACAQAPGPSGRMCAQGTAVSTRFCRASGCALASALHPSDHRFAAGVGDGEDISLASSWPLPHPGPRSTLGGGFLCPDPLPSIQASIPAGIQLLRGTS